MSTSTRFSIGDRVVTPSGTAATVIGNHITPQGVNACIEYKERASYAQGDLEYADPGSVDAVAKLSAEVFAARNTAAAAPKAVPTKKKR